MKTIEHIGYIAGVLEGEGSFTAYVYQKNRIRNGKLSPCREKSVMLRVSMTDLDILERLQLLTGVGVIKQKKTYSPLSRKVQYEWKITNRTYLREFLPILLLWMSIRRKGQIYKMLEVLA